jgi:hypothetical protein
LEKEERTGGIPKAEAFIVERIRLLVDPLMLRN